MIYYISPSMEDKPSIVTKLNNVCVNSNLSVRQAVSSLSPFTWMEEEGKRSRRGEKRSRREEN